ncbi:endonuclease [bacterium (Candidatus Gribaldobacteria) CG07_land_8_20_14_0_80_33_18]|uniref:Endonuclease n=1 Tax=bacterium (Candidatus Gribaldobacteria) CG07_land_8_20_14_0_80_33_18 TaxID=2014272 RepID=A0A2M6Z2B5_9BACT|nr:MAG: endonuclease [bacterium (Candidatus Gribaldobacteria) CG10_big_fil_rev_8_21_14_0_10_33_41]PIU46550.1 MAG: endonuclease [bacterium (Candidatus Gribaldobacteria) CG07_land_8_20_14_0_80_33_18]PJA01101.1 MAG: endonuclease [bacterium (Candidatus Gribaldobacteria) CG_4_10_14_0_2_um_filter_33_15]PJB08412.1 MAG: endonuclease [bacterium (Candidatus Gribaldobacteria) CG_4_9_14_3_um_filter_33_9]
MFERLYKELRKKYGKPKEQWNLWCKRPKTKQEKEEVVIGAILTQRTNWKNVELALENLKNKKIVSLESLYHLGSKKLASLIKPAGFYKAKAQYLFNLVKFIVENYGSLEKLRKVGLKELREKLLKVKGVGPETADSILLYALDKPIFVIDEYAKRLIKERNLIEKTNYHFLQKLFEENLRKDFRLYQDFHALIVINGKNKKRPLRGVAKGDSKNKK